MDQTTQMRIDEQVKMAMEFDRLGAVDKRDQCLSRLYDYPASVAHIDAVLEANGFGFFVARTLRILKKK